MDLQLVTHTFEPVFDENSRILILGTLPSVKSRENNFYYGHPQNRFWRVIAALTNNAVPTEISEKKQMLLDNGIAIWDVIKECEICNSADSTIRSVKVNDLTEILGKCNIEHIFANGKTAEKLFNRYIKKTVKIDIVPLPSTSPSNAAWSLEKLTDEWKQIFETGR